VKQTDKLKHAAVFDESIDPVNRLISEEQSEFVQLAYFDILRLRCLPQVGDELGRLDGL
jgi:hypothetical protein